MGHATTENTTVGRRGTHYRPILRRLIRQVELHPPPEVRITPGHGGKNHLSPHGYVGKHLWEWAETRRQQAIANGDLSAFNWQRVEGAVSYLFNTAIRESSFGHNAAWDLIEAWLPVFREHLREVMAKPIAEDDEDSRTAGAQRLATGGTVAGLPEPPPEPAEAVEGEPARRASGWLESVEVDPEIVAVAAIVRALSDLPNNEARKRSLVYAADRFGLEFAGVPIQRANA